MCASLQRPRDSGYFIEPWSDTFLQGDLFRDVPIAIPAPPDAIFIGEGERRFVSGPFDATFAMLISPSCSIAAQGAALTHGAYAHSVRSLVPIRSVRSLVEAGAISPDNLGHLRADHLRNYLYVPAGPGFAGVKGWPESVALLYMPISLHHDVIADDRVAQLSGSAHRHLRVKLMALYGGFTLDPDVLGAPQPDRDRTI